VQESKCKHRKQASKQIARPDRQTCREPVAAAVYLSLFGTMSKISAGKVRVVCERGAKQKAMMA